MGSVFDHEHKIDSRLSIQKNSSVINNTPFGKRSGRKSTGDYNMDLKIEGMGNSKMSFNRKDSIDINDQIIESEREMQEIIARDNLLDTEIQNTPIETANFNTNVRIGEGEMLNFKQSEYSQFMQNRDMANAGNNTQSDLNRSEFNAPVEPADYEHLYQTLSNMPYNKEDFETDKNQSKIPSLMTKVKVFSPTVVNHK